MEIIYLKTRKVKLRSNQCSGCPFLKQNQDMLPPYRWAEIYQYLFDGTNHICHSTDEHVCRGGRNWQLVIWFREGKIKAPTDDALFEEMRKSGIEPEITECEFVSFD